MVNQLLLATIMMCPIPQLVGPIPVDILERAIVVCKEQYNGCVAKIEKRGPMSYWVICKRSK